MTDTELREALLALASNWHARSANLLSADWEESYGSLPTIRQRQFGMALEAGIAADEVVRLLGMDPASLWEELPRVPRLPEEERSKMTWTSGSDAQ